MAEEHLLGRVRREIRQRLEATESLIRERERLERALQALEGLGDGPVEAEAAPRAARRRDSRPQRRRAPRGQRRDELLRLVKGSPGLSVSEAARQIGISPSQAFSLVRRLEEEGTVRREGRRLIFVAPAASQAGDASGPSEPGASAAGHRSAAGAAGTQVGAGEGTEAAPDKGMAAVAAGGSEAAGGAAALAAGAPGAGDAAGGDEDAVAPGTVSGADGTAQPAGGTQPTADESPLGLDADEGINEGASDMLAESPATREGE